MDTQKKLESEFMLKKIGYENLTEEAKKAVLESGIKSFNKKLKLKEKPKLKKKKKKTSGMAIKRSLR